MNYSDYDEAMCRFKALTVEEQKKILSLFLLFKAEQEEKLKEAKGEVETLVIQANIAHYQLAINLFTANDGYSGKQYLINEEPHIKKRVFGKIDEGEA